MKYVCPLIVVTDIKRSREFYTSLLKQKVKADFGENVTFEGDFAIHLDSHFGGLIDGKEIRFGGNDAELYFENDEVETLLPDLKKAGVEFVHELREQPWRQQVIRFYDPDGHIIEVGESLEHTAFRLHMEGMDTEKISIITYMPPELVTAAIEKYAD